jgi:hypothetical protein
MRARKLVLLLMAGTAWAEQTGGGGAPGPQGSGGATLGANYGEHDLHRYKPPR